jgi:hypothetical protein
VISVLCSSQSALNNAASPRTPDSANIAKALNMRRDRRASGIDATMESTFHGKVKPFLSQAALTAQG